MPATGEFVIHLLLLSLSLMPGCGCGPTAGRLEGGQEASPPILIQSFNDIRNTRQQGGVSERSFLT